MTILIQLSVACKWILPYFVFVGLNSDFSFAYPPDGKKSSKRQANCSPERTPDPEGVPPRANEVEKPEQASKKRKLAPQASDPVGFPCE